MLSDRTEYQMRQRRRRTGFRTYRRSGVFFSLNMAACYRRLPNWRDYATTIRNNLRAAGEADQAWRASGGRLP